MKIQRLKKAAVTLMAVLCVALFNAPVATAVDPGDVPAGATAEVIGGKIAEEAKSELLKTEIPVDPDFDEKIPEREKKEEVAFYIKKIHLIIDDEKILTEDQLAPLLAEYENQEVTFSDLNILIKQLQAAYRSAGYLGVAYIPPQKIENQEVSIRVIMARMGELQLEGARYFRASKTKSYWTIPKGEVILYNDIKDNLFEMNQNSDRQVRPVLKAGASPGTTDVHLVTEEKFPIHIGHSLDGQGVKLTGKKRNGFTIRHNNFLSFDDTLVVGTVFGDVFGAFFVNHILPLSKFGTRLITSFSTSQVNPKKEFDRFGINGVSQSYSVDVRQRVYRTDKVNVDAYIGFDWKEKRTRIVSVTSAWDRVRVLSAGYQLQARDKSGLWSLGQDIDIGIPLHGDGFPLASRGGESQFFKYKFSLGRQQRLPLSLRASLNISGQLSDSRLLPQEQMFMGGASTVRGYPESDYGADQGIISKAELYMPAYFIPKHFKIPHAEMTVRDQLNFFGFIDHGYGRLNQHRSTERKSRNLIGSGAGVMFQFNRNFSARLEWAYSLGDVPLSESSRNQVHFRIKTDL